MNWESLKTKYNKIIEIVHKNYPKTGDIEEFPYRQCLQELHKARITSKIKKIVLIIRKLLIWARGVVEEG